MWLQEEVREAVGLAATTLTPASYSEDPELEPWQVLLYCFKVSHGHILAARHEKTAKIATADQYVPIREHHALEGKQSFVYSRYSFTLRSLDPRGEVSGGAAWAQELLDTAVCHNTISVPDATVACPVEEDALPCHPAHTQPRPTPTRDESGNKRPWRPHRGHVVCHGNVPLWRQVTIPPP